MESFNKNWLAIILIVIVFTSIGFLFGWTFKSHCHEKKMNMMYRNCGPEMFNIPISDEEIDSLKNIDVQVTIDEKGNVLKSCSDSCKKKVIIKKIIKE